MCPSFTDVIKQQRSFVSFSHFVCCIIFCSLQTLSNFYSPSPSFSFFLRVFKLCTLKVEGLAPVKGLNYLHMRSCYSTFPSPEGSNKTGENKRQMQPGKNVAIFFIATNYRLFFHYYVCLFFLILCFMTCFCDSTRIL